MKVISNLQEFSKPAFSAVTIGTFDGVHLGHQQLINKIKEKANSINGKSGMLTFHPHPRMILNPGDKGLKLLTSIEEKAELLPAAFRRSSSCVRISVSQLARGAELLIHECKHG